MRRREFITLFSTSIVAWPLTARAQQAAMPVIGFLNSGSAEAFKFLVAAFRQGLSESGYVEGQNLAIEYRWADGDYEKLRRLAADLVGRRVSVILANGPPAVVAAKVATATIPIVFTSGGNPVELGLVSSLNQPSGNVTGVSFLNNELGAKRLELLRELVPAATSVGFLANPTRPSFRSEVKNAQQAAQALGVKLIILNASTEAEIDAAFAEFSRRRIAELLVGTGFAFLRAPRPDRRVGQSFADRDDVPLPRVRRRWRPDQLCAQCCRGVSTSRHLCRKDSERGKAS